MSFPQPSHAPRPTAGRPSQPKWTRHRLLLAILAVLLVVLLLIIAPGLVGLAGLVALIVGIVWLVKAKRRSHRSKRGLTAVIAGAAAFVLGGSIAGAGTPAEQTPPPAPVAFAPQASNNAAAPAKKVVDSVAERVGSSCDDDALVVTQGSESVYCDKVGAALVWVNAVKHGQLQDDAKKQAVSLKAAADKKAADKVAAEKKASAAKAAAQKKAAAAKKATAEKKAAAQRAADKKAADKKAADQRVAAKKAAAKKKAEAERKQASAFTYYANCTAVRDAGAAPIYSGDPGYSRKLDRDGDGVACE